MLHTLFTGSFILSFILLALLVFHYWNRISVFQSLLFVGVVIINFGYMQLSDAQNLEMAIRANQTVYLGVSFAPFFFMMCMADLCKVPVKRWIQMCFVIFGCFLFYCGSTVGHSSLYYQNVTFVVQNGVGRIQKEYGPMHMLYPMYLLVVVLVQSGILIRSFMRKRDVSYVTSSTLLVIMLLMVLAYILQRALKLDFELIPFSYVAGQAAMLYLLRRMSLYDISSITADSMVRSVNYGFMLFDSNGRFLGADAAAKLWFPEVGQLHIDAPVREEYTPFLRQIGAWLRREDEARVHHFQQGQRYIEAEHTVLREQADHLVHSIYLWDHTQQHEYTQLVERYNENLERDVAEKTGRIRRIQEDIIVSMANIVENRDSNTGGHIARTSDIIRIFVRHLQEKAEFDSLTPEIADCIVKAAPLHDLGKIAVPDVILNKPGKFTDEEYAEMKKHSAKGAVIVARVLQSSDDMVFKNIAINVAHYHHEKWNGTGYPEGLKETEIPFEARVMALADVFDALVSKRVYKEKYSYDRAFSIIEESGGSHFDPELCRLFLECRPELEKLFDSYRD